MIAAILPQTKRWISLGVAFLLLGLSGCVYPPGPNMDDRILALELIDQGTLFLRAGDLKRARSAFEVAQELVPSAAAVDGLGCVALLLGDAQTAQKHFLEAYKMDAGYTHSLGNLALLYESQGYAEAAQQLYQRAVAENPENYRFRNNFAVFLNKQPGVKGSAPLAITELLKAEVLARHPLIEANIKKLE